MMGEKGFRIGNIDSTVSLESPKLRPFIDQIRAKLAGILNIEIDQISVKAKTAEKLDAVGEGKAIKAESIVLLSSK
jgi:2-C-methyl-D-erythritol 2,4-cyclodiphosphate synthase